MNYVVNESDLIISVNCNNDDAESITLTVENCFGDCFTFNVMNEF